MYSKTFILRLVRTRMPFGKHKGWYITDLPVHYLEWFNREGFPEGQLGQYLATMYEIKINGLEAILVPFQRQGYD